MDALYSIGIKWLQECLDTHQACRFDRNFSAFPKRILYLDDGRTSTHQIQLISSSAYVYYYCALSYCWGTKEDNYGNTTTENIGDRAAGFNATDLPQTIQDAIIFCRRLGISYLWVDSVCIVQDDSEEWKAEASAMDQIYHNALLTLTATSSEHANHGLFTPRYQRNKFSWLPSVPDAPLINPLSEDKWRNPWEYDGAVGIALTTKIAKRAWTLQEELLSARNIFWTFHGLVWLCPTSFKREWVPEECIRQAIHLRPSEQADIPLEFIRRRHLAFINKNASYDQAKQAWADALSAYLPRRISRSEDRLAAIVGLAKILQPQLKDEYLAGLWLKSIPEDLLWGRTEISYNKAMERKPSWSWATLPANCTANAWEGYGYSNATTPFCSIENIEIELLGTALIDPPHSGIIQIRTVKRPFPSRDSREHDGHITLGADSYDCTGFYISVDLDLPRISHEYVLERVECLKILELFGKEFCLLVEPVDPDSVTTAFRRLGRAEIVSKSDPDCRNLLFGLGIHSQNSARANVDIRPENGFFTDCAIGVFNLV